jgi:glycyl-tRNA synthetase beta chain
VKVVAETGWELDLEAAISSAMDVFSGISADDGADAAAALEAFVAERVRRYLTDEVGVAFDTADAVMAAGWSRLAELVARARALDEAREAAEFRALGLAFKRVKNITDSELDAGVNADLFSEPEEAELHTAAARFHGRLAACLSDGNFSEAFEAMGELAGVLDSFFDEVLVMCEDDAIRANRIAVLKALGRDFLALADLSKLQIEGGDG